MELATLLEQNRETILGRWFDLIAGTYPEVTSAFLAKQKDQFRNPVGHAISQSIGPIYDQVLSAMDTDELLRALDGVIRIRSVQDFTPSEAVVFIFQLKTAIREVWTLELGVPRSGMTCGASNRESTGSLCSRSRSTRNAERSSTRSETTRSRAER